MAAARLAQHAFIFTFAWCQLLSLLPHWCSSTPPFAAAAAAAAAAARRDGDGDGDAPRPWRGPGTIRMAQRLKELLEQRNPAVDPAVKSDQKVAHYEQIVEKQRRDAEMPPAKRVKALWSLGQELLNGGRTERSIETFGELAAVLDEVGLPDDHATRRSLTEMRGLAYLRLGEQQNCIHRHSPDSCILPIRGDGVHVLREPSSRAVEMFSSLLAMADISAREYPDQSRLSLVWLLNIAHMTLGRWPDDVPPDWLVPPDAFSSDHPLPRWNDAAAAAGADLRGLSGGVVAEDLDGDGLVDLLVSDWSSEKQLRFLRNDGNGTFSDRTLAAGLEGLTGGLNMIHGDYDNDGLADVYVLRGAWRGRHGHDPNSLLRNLGDGRFEDVTEAAGLGASQFPTQTGSFVDYNRDGHLDLFVGNEATGDDRVPCELYRNNGDGTFTDVASEVGLDIVAFVKAAAWGDYDNDGYPDLFLSRLFEPNLLFRNADCGARFVDVSTTSGTAGPLLTFPAWWWDYDNDGWQDLMVLPFPGFGSRQELTSVAGHYRGMRLSHRHNATYSERIRPHLYRNKGDGTFEEEGIRKGLDVPMLAMGANFADIDNDGWLDVYVGTGAPYLGTLTPNLMFRNDGGHHFQDVTTAGRFGHLQKGHGIAFADLDGDGDLDLYAVMGGAFEGDVFQNAMFLNPTNNATHSGQNRWLDIALWGTYSTRSAIGARLAVTVEYTDGERLRGDGDTSPHRRTFHRTVGTGGSFGSSSLRTHIGLGPATRIERVEICWPSPAEMATHTLANVPLDSSIRVVEGNGTSRWVKEDRQVVHPPFGRSQSVHECSHQHHPETHEALHLGTDEEL